MEYRSIGRTAVSLSRVGLGGFELGPMRGKDPNIDGTVAVIEAAIDAGINWLDTSECYIDSENESLIGAALGRVDGEFLVATKVCPEGAGSGFRRDQVHAACRASLRRLDRDYIDVYLLHWPDDTGVPLEETWSAMSELADAGLVRTIGLCNYSSEEIERCHAQRPVDVTQDGLSLVDFLDNRALMARCGELGISVTVFDVLGSGILGGRTPQQVRTEWEQWWEPEFLTNHAAFKRVFGLGRAERSAAVAEGLRPIAARLGATTAQVAIAWVLQQPGVSAALAGSRSPRHLRENGEAAGLDLTSVLAEIEALIPLGPAFAPES